MANICQSCAMPMENESLYGTNADGSVNSDYCKYCYKDGEFLQKVTMDEYIEMMVPFASQAGMSGDQMREYCKSVYPTLKRWKK
ncbi:MAG: zinc ribbon domain-containing protein, partial [Alphaproteobacteria bacterium]|nr:zinc ribbon domain-containing protein [Alphaproteobacteria bacterium]